MDIYAGSNSMKFPHFHAGWPRSLLFSIPGGALAETRLMRQPYIHGTTIVFVYGGDL